MNKEVITKRFTTREEFDDHCKKYNYELYPHANRIIKSMNEKDRCNCIIDRKICPCPEHHKEIEEKNYCSCRFIWKKGTLPNF